MVSEKENTEEKIINAAINVFVRKGYDGSRMQEIADEAGINKSLLHYYFRSKDKLFEKVFTDIFSKIMDSLVGVVENSKTLDQLLTSFVSVYVDFLKNNSHVPIFILHELHRNPEMIVDLIKSKGINKDLLIGLFELDEIEFELQDFDPLHIFVNILSMSVFPFVAAPLLKGFIFSGKIEDYDKFIDERKEHIVNFVKAAIIKNKD
jgi:AcrR family transcriptional regulator